MINDENNGRFIGHLNFVIRHSFDI